MPRILSISYDSVLLKTRQLLLERNGFQVQPAVGFSAAIELCKTENFDLVIICHTIPAGDKEQIAKQLREVCATPILALHRPHELPLKSADYNLDSGDPGRFVECVQEILNLKSQPRAK